MTPAPQDGRGRSRDRQLRLRQPVGSRFAFAGRMSIATFEPMLRKATIRAIDRVCQKFAGAKVTRENPVTNLLNRWKALEPREKEDVANIIIATTITAVSAIAAVARSKKKVTKSAKKVGKRMVKRVAPKLT
jgi:hypothetical protein